MSETILTDENFKEEVLGSKEPVLVDFGAPWCGPCKMMEPVIEELAKEYEGKPIKIAKLNVDENSRTAEEYKIMGIPAFKVFKGGEVIEEFTGAQPKEAIKGRLDKLLEG